VKRKARQNSGIVDIFYGFCEIINAVHNLLSLSIVEKTANLFAIYFKNSPLLLILRVFWG